MTFKSFLLMSFCFLYSPTSLAEVIPLDQDRTVSCSAFAEDDQWNESDGDSASAPDFELFNEGVSATIYIGSAYASGSAYQLSVIDPTLFFVYGGCAANGEGYDYEGFGEAQGNTFFQCEFEVTESKAFSLTGQLEAYDDGDASLGLTGPGISLYLDAGSNNNLDLNESGNLAPGIYIFTVQANSSAYGDFYNYGYAYGAFDLELEFTSTSATPIPSHDDLALRLSPNPFSHGTEIFFSAPSRRTSNLEIFDLRGRLVRRLVTGSRESGRLSWDGKNSRGQAVATGTYFVVLKSGNEIRREKAILVR